jgi:cysteine desulfurase/selenocysteine lyase
MEHHANIVPWQQLAVERGIELRWIPLTADGRLDLSELDRLVDGVKVVSVTAMSNVLGTINPVADIVAAAHAAGALAVVDACQSVPHMPTDVTAWGADLVAFSGHKMCGPTGIGVLWGRESVLDAMPPFLGGGNMIADVRLDGFDPAPLPAKFEAGTPPITEAVGLGAAVDYLSAIGMDAVRRHEIDLTTAALAALEDRFGDSVTVHGPVDPAVRGATFSLAVGDIHPHDVSQVFDQRNVCVRAGHHCAKPLMRLLGASATVRASFYLYNNHDDVTALCDAVQDTFDFFGR